MYNEKIEQIPIYNKMVPSSCSFTMWSSKTLSYKVFGVLSAEGILIEVRLFPLTLVLIMQVTINKKCKEEVDSKMKLIDEKVYKSFGVFIKSWTRFIHDFPRSIMEIPPCGEAPKSEVRSSVQAEILDREDYDSSSTVDKG
jgi:hypothetical protein